MKQTVLTKANIRFIKANRLKMSGSDMAKRFGISKSVVNSYMRHHGLAVPSELAKKFRAKAMIGKTTFTPAEDAIIKANYLTVPIKTLGESMGRSFTGIMGRIKSMGLQLPKNLREERKSVGMFKKGIVPVNKGKKQIEYMTAAGIERTKATRFKTGTVPPNHKPVGYERIDVKDGYTWVKVGEGMHQFKLKHRLIWEQHNGPVPKGYLVMFKDGDRTNFSISNLVLRTKKQNMLLNTMHNYPKPIAKVIQLRGALNRQINKHIKKISNEK